MKTLPGFFCLLTMAPTTLVSEKQPAGRYNEEWDAGGFSSGVYYYRIRINEQVQTNKIILVK